MVVDIFPRSAAAEERLARGRAERADLRARVGAVVRECQRVGSEPAISTRMPFCTPMPAYERFPPGDDIGATRSGMSGGTTLLTRDFCKALRPDRRAP